MQLSLIDYLFRPWRMQSVHVESRYLSYLTSHGDTVNVQAIRTTYVQWWIIPTSYFRVTATEPKK